MNVIPSLPIATTYLEEAFGQLNQFPIIKIRKDMGFQEYTTYKNDWIFFNNVWAYNYMILQLNSTQGTRFSYFQFTTNLDHISYTHGQIAHIECYPDIASTGIFNTPSIQNEPGINTKT